MCNKDTKIKWYPIIYSALSHLYQYTVHIAIDLKDIFSSTSLPPSIIGLMEEQEGLWKGCFLTVLGKKRLHYAGGLSEEKQT